MLTKAGPKSAIASASTNWQLIVVGVMVMVYVGFRSMLTESRSARDYLVEVQNGGTFLHGAITALARWQHQTEVIADSLVQSQSDSKTKRGRQIKSYASSS